MKTFPLPLALALMATTAPALAADLTPNQKVAFRDAETSDGDLRIGRAAPGFQFIADGDATSVAFTYAKAWQGKDTKTKAGMVQNLSFKLSTPFDKETQEGNFLTATGRFSNGTSLGFSYAWIIMPNPPLPGTPEQREAVQAFYERSEQACFAAGKTPCPSHDVLVAQGVIPENRDLVDHAFLDGNIWQWGLSGEVGRQAFDYRDPVTLAELSDHHTVFSGAVNGGMRLRGDRAYVGAAVEYNNGREEGSKRILCRATTTAGVTECFDSPYAAPTDDESLNLMGVARWRSSVSHTPYAFEVKAGYDTQSKIYGVVTSLYLVPDNDGALRGGLRLGWQSNDDDPATDDDNLTVGVFLGVPFQVF